MVTDASFEIFGPFTTALSAPMSYNWSNHAGTLSFGFCLNLCTRSIISAAVYGRAVTCSMLWAGVPWSGDSPLAYPFFVVVVCLFVFLSSVCGTADENFSCKSHFGKDVSII